MKNANYTAVGVVLWSILLVSLVIQSLVISYFWLSFDSRVSCERLIRWDEWISCMHGKSHLHIVMSEIAVVAWLAAGVTAFLARILPPYISMIVPGVVAAFWLWSMIHYWNEKVVPFAHFGVPTAKEVFVFAVLAIVIAAYVVAPAAGAWLFGLRGRKRNWPDRQPSPVNA